MDEHGTRPGRVRRECAIHGDGGPHPHPWGRVGSVALVGVILLQLAWLPGCGKPTPSGNSAKPAAEPGLQDPPIGVEGSDALVIFSGKPAQSISARVLPTPPGSEISLTTKKSRVRLIFHFGGIIELTGAGKLVLRRDGFLTEDGTFFSAFRGVKNQLKVKVPQATLGIRGTKILFQLKKGQGSLQLREGLVDVIPDEAGKPTRPWKTGETLTLDERGIQWQRSSSDRVPSSGSYVPPTDDGKAIGAALEEGESGELGTSAWKLSGPEQ